MSRPAESANADEARDLPGRENIDLVRNLELEGLRQRNLTERVSDAITRRIGTLGFLLFHLALFLAWFGINLRGLPGVEPFDPFPFGILTLIVSAEGVLLAIFVLISQNRMTRDADRRARLDLQVNLLTEQSSTKVLQVLQQIADRVGVEVQHDPELQKLAQPTDIQRIAAELEREPRA